ncbi:methyltransferase domain-containing protein [Paracoccus sp. TK19116]|uniref:Methyltransferase domain-containing protein n=1 Tax=Paracoccus albicereus TaxID=2922394 RepID=A0ABT1MRX5_9RHOB|nr:methyltransferase domain-containing protein [Paracoccus albicereus]MCQ0970899.1 methyltransferase domain-containing protein [Paracoccus albicereus]
MQSPSPASRPALTDRTALARHRMRAVRTGMADVLHRIAADEIHDRLAEINRTFTDIAVVSGFPDLWSALLPGARSIADDDILVLAPGSLDLVVHAMALHWADDPVGQIVQCARALRPDGLFLAILPAGQTLHELRAVMAQAESEITGGLSPRVLPMGDLRDLGGLLARGALALPVADILPVPASYRNLIHLAQDLRAMGEQNALAGRLRRPTDRAVFARAAGLYAERFPDASEPARIQASFELAFLTGWAPSDSQPKPLRPGSAKMALADALNQIGKTP